MLMHFKMNPSGGKISPKGEGGFTLLEILVAITILSFIFGIVYSSFSSISDSDKRIHSANNISVKVRNLMEYMVKDISSSLYPQSSDNSGGNFDSLAYGFTSDAGDGTPRLNFTALVTNPVYMADRSLVEIGYYLAPQKGGQYSLIRRVDETPDANIIEGGYSEELMRDVSSLEFKFLKSGGDWVEVWNVRGSPTITSFLPKAVRIKIGLFDEAGEEQIFSTEVSLISARTI